METDLRHCVRRAEVELSFVFIVRMIYEKAMVIECTSLLFYRETNGTF